jgi:lipopolysaccharide/colanic/teichoic acid biosynthesis glycosyltransferase
MSILGLQSANIAPAGPAAAAGTVRKPPLVGWTHGRLFTGKRVFDLIVTLAAMPAWLPLLVVLIAAVKISDPRNPAIFRQRRTGYRGRRFKVFKIRTMVPNAEQLVKELMAHNEVGGPQFKMRNDPRVTRLGRLLRKTCLDELPQLFNVLKGEMSLVGPRPASANFDDYSDWWKARLMARPGLTGRWQVDRHLCSDFDGRARLDIAYMRRRSMAQDLSLLARTVVFAFVRRSGM